MRTRTEGTKKEVQDPMGTMSYWNSGRLQEYPLLSPKYYNSYKTCIDELHPNYPNSGGPLSITSLHQSFSDSDVKTGSTGVPYPSGGFYTGTVYDYTRRVLPSSRQAYPVDASSECQALGPDAWDRFRPKLTQVGLGQFVAEIRDVPALFKFRLKQFKDLGSDYLNVQFGWKPFISDLRNWIQSLLRLDKQLAQMQSNNGKWLKRGGILFTDEGYFEDNAYYVTPTNGLTVLFGKRMVQSTEKAWFVGSFRYYIPGLSDGSWGKLRMARKLWGLELTPALVYELIPFSWLLDWFSNVGSVISNMNAITDENLVAKYAYVMHHRIVSIECVARVKGTYSEWRKTPTYSYANLGSNCTVETKCRAAASPFGFNFGLADFSNYQLSILAALGTSYLKF